MRRECGTSDDWDDLGRRLHERSQQLVSEGRIEEFVDLIHPLELARFKSFFLALIDAAESDLVAQELLTKFDAYLVRNEAVEADAREVATAYFRMSLDPTQEGEDVTSQLASLPHFADTRYCGVVLEGEHTVHVLYTPFIWPTVATYQWHHGDWKLKFRSNLAKLTAWMKGDALSKKDGLKDFMGQLVEVQYTKLEAIGYLVSESWAFVVFRLESVIGDLVTVDESVYPVSKEDPAWSHLDNRVELEAILVRELKEQTGKSVVPLAKAAVEMVERLEKVNDIDFESC